MRKLVFGGILLASLGLGFVGCKKDLLKGQIINHEQQSLKIDYSFFEYSNYIIGFVEKNGLNQPVENRVQGLEQFQQVIETLNTEFGSNLYISNFDLFLIENPTANLQDMHDNGFLSQSEFDRLVFFYNDLNQYTFDESIERLVNKILREDSLEVLDDKHIFLINTLRIIKERFNSDNKASGSAAQTAGCAIAIASNAYSTWGLTSCFIPGPNCWGAVFGKALSLAGMFISC